jgi:hypothetical protein
MRRGKTVFVFGAGFSKPANFPLQKELLQAITDGPHFLGYGILDDKIIPKDIITDFNKESRVLTSFLAKTFEGNEQSLEDIFTLLDQTIAEKGALLEYSYIDLIKLREKWVRCILFMLHACSIRHLRQQGSPYIAFAKKLITKRISAKINGDPFSVITLNWDSLIEDSIFRVIRREKLLCKVDVDYCVYTTPMDMNVRSGPHMPGPKQKASHRFNIKILKLHGSATWLRCPSSGLVFTALGKKISPYSIYYRKQISPFLKKYKGKNDDKLLSYLEPYIITPTYTKVFDLPHIKTVWHNAYVELREAKHIVFIGYSMPESDYHFRTLLRRAILPDTSIQVILSSNDNTANIMSDRERNYLPESRYRRLFGDRPVFEYSGVEEFISNFL